MKKSVSILIVLFFVIVGFAFHTFFMAQRPKSFQITGRVIGTNLRSSTVTIAPGKGEPLTIVVNEKTVLARAGKNITLAVLAVIEKGNEAVVTYEIKWGKKIAKSINIQEQPLPSRKPPSTKGKR